MSSEFLPINRIGHFYDASVEEPKALWQEFAETGIDFPVCLDAETEDETDDLPLPDDSVTWQRLLAVATQEAIDANATSVEFTPGPDDVVVGYISDVRQNEADTLPREAYNALVRYLRRIADNDRIEVQLGNRSIRLTLEFRQSDHGQQTVLLPPREQ